MLPKSERRRVLRKSQSIRWIVAGFVLTVVESVASAVGDELLPGPKWLRAAVIGMVLAAAFVARFMAAREDDGDGD